MHQPPQRLIRQAVAAFCGYMQSERLPPGRQEDLRRKAERLAGRVTRSMGAKDDNERLMVWEEITHHAHRQIESRRLKALGVEGY